MLLGMTEGVDCLHDNTSVDRIINLSAPEKFGGGAYPDSVLIAHCGRC
jgi:hypothetical protein